MNDLTSRCGSAGARRSRAAYPKLLALCSIFAATSGPVLAEKIAWGGNRVANGSFESIFENWNRRLGAKNDGARKEAVVEIDTSVAHTGVHSMKFSGDAETTIWHAFESEPISITPGKRYKFSAWTKAEDIRVEGQQYHNCNAYLQFRDDTGAIVPIGGSPLRRTHASRGSHDWFDAYTIVVAPEGATQARIGVTLTCSGTVWFDDVALVESDDYAWAKRTSDSFVWYCTQGDEPDDAVLKAADAYLRRLEEVLDLKHTEPIRYYKYKSIDQKTELTDRSSESHINGGDIHSVKWDEHQDLVHALMQPLGASTLVLAEGTAIYATAAVDGRDVHAAARQLVNDRTVIPITTFLDPSALTIAPRHVKEAEFGSFVGYLVQRYGIEKFKELYVYPDAKDAATQVAGRFETVYGKSLEEGQAEWILFLQSGATRPEPASGAK